MLSARISASLFAGVLIGSIGCGAGNNTSSTSLPTPTVNVSILPSSANLTTCGIQQFSASVTGSGNTAVMWSVLEGQNGGSISTAGLFTAPNLPGTYHVVATSIADATRNASAQVVVSATVPLAVSPATNVLRKGGTCTFSVTPSTPVNWTVAEGSTGGAITADGIYTAPATLGTYHVVATEIADPGKTATAAVTVLQSGFTFVGSMAQSRAAHTATLLANGRVLIVDGGYFDIDDLVVPITAVELFDPTTGTFSLAGQSVVAREFQTATLLLNGKVLIAGGSYNGSDSSATAEIYDPVSGQMQQTGSMAISRSGHTATLLADGRVLVVGGSSSNRAVASAEIYDPQSGTFSPTGSMVSARIGHTATMLPNGKILIAGGMNDFFQVLVTSTALATAEIYDPQSGSFSSTGSMVSPRTGHTATLLNDGTVLVAGGANSSPLASTEVYDPATRQFRASASMFFPRTNHTATLLPNGSVLVVGGVPEVPSKFVGYAPTFTAEIYDPLRASFVQTGSMADGRFWHTATLLGDGRVLVVGGGHSDAPLNGSDSVPTAETYF